MRMVNGFDRLSTEEELGQVLAVLSEYVQNGLPLTESMTDSQTPDLWADDLLDDSTCAESLVELMETRPELKN